METKVALIGIIITEKSLVKSVNELLHDYSDFIKGRMGLPYEKKNIFVISIVLDAPPEIINALAGRLGMIKGIKAKTLF